MRDGRSSCWLIRRRIHPQSAGQKPAVISPLALEAVRRIDALFEIE
jgi:hypothetical protein